MSKSRIPTTDEEFDAFIRSTTEYLLSDTPPEEEMLFEDGEEMEFEDGEKMEYED
jgi:hypothetical protein